MTVLLRAAAGMLAMVLCLAADARPVSLEAQVTHVSDGDTLWVRPLRGGPSQAVRIEGIDAPELCQAGGAASREALARRVLHQRVHVVSRGRDDFDRLLARVRFEGQDVGAWQVALGHAWSYRYRRDPGPYAKEERSARQLQRGLWRERAPLPPREFRRRHGPCAADSALPR